jgi:catechol 2,3-dioxygenase-like lactoylglutathione lyase family enzyme
MSATETTTNISQLGTVGIPVRDQDKALDFYVGVLGFEKGMDVAFGQGERWVEVAPSGASTSIALMRVGDGLPTGVDTRLRLTTSDARADHAGLLGRGVDVDPDVMPYPVPMFSFRDPDGNRLIIVERPTTARPQ